MRVANLDAVASAIASRTEAGWRALDVRVWDGIDIRLLSDRGFDCFGAWYRGVPLAWVSGVGERGPISGRLRDDDWLRGFGGGLSRSTHAARSRATRTRSSRGTTPWTSCPARASASSSTK